MDVLLLPFDGSGDKKSAEQQAGEKASAVPLMDELARLNGRSSLFWMARALAQSQRARRILVACSAGEEEALRRELPADARFSFEHFSVLERIGNSPGDSLVQEARDFHAALARVLRRPTVVVSCERPLIEGKTLDSLIAYVAQENLDATLVYVRRDVAEQAWGEVVPEPPRLTVEPLHLVALGVVSPPLLDGALGLLERFAPDIERLNRSENTENFSTMAPLAWKVARTVGLGCSLRLIRHKADVKEIERVASRLLKCRFGLVECRSPNVLLSASNAKHHALIEERLR